MTQQMKSTSSEDDRELSRLVAEKVMGWHKQDDGLNWRWADASGKNGEYVATYSPATDIASAMLVEDRIAELGLQHEYGFILAKACPAWTTTRKMGHIYWEIAHATPRQRCEAALEVLNAAS